VVPPFVEAATAMATLRELLALSVVCAGVTVTVAVPVPVVVVTVTVAVPVTAAYVESPL
jgi:hypothetical protein